MSNYPPGVTGNEFEITGATTEIDRPESCPRCEALALTQSTYRDRTWLYCYSCGFTEYPDANGMFPSMEEDLQ